MVNGNGLIMACHYLSKESQISNGVYWVRITIGPLTNGGFRNEWSMGVVRNGHFHWLHPPTFDGSGQLPEGGGLGITPISLKELIKKEVPMILVEKPKK